MMRFFLLIRTGIICVLLATAAIFFGYQAVEIWSGSNQPVVKKAEKKPTKRQIKPGVVYRRNPRSKDFEVIAQKDLFSSDRREKLPEKSTRPAPVKAAQSLDKRFVLFGILITGDEKKALVANLDNKSAQEKAHIWVKAGDKIGNLSVSEILPDQIVLTQGGRTYTVRLLDHNPPQKRVSRQKKKKPPEPSTTIIKRPKVKRPAAKESKSSS